MARFVFGRTIDRVFDASNLLAPGSTFRVELLMTLTTVGSQPDVGTNGSFTTPDQFNGVGWPSGGLTLSGVTSTYTTIPAGTYRVVLDSIDPTTAGGISNGSRKAAAYLVWVENPAFPGSFSAGWPLVYSDQPGFPFNPGGQKIKIVWSTDGFLYCESSPLP